MMPVPGKKTLQSAVALIGSATALIGSINAIGRVKLQAKLSGADPGAMAQLAEWMREADLVVPGPAKETARAWILLKYLALFWAGPQQLVAPSDRERNEKLTEVSRRSQASLREDIIDMVTGRGAMKIFASRQNNPSRKVWDTAFTDPGKHNPLSFQYLIHGMRPTTSLPLDIQKSPLRAAYLKRSLAGNLGVIDLVNHTWQLFSAQLYLTNPAVIRSEVLSCSVISNSHVKTYNDCSFGLVLSVPAMNICCASTTDLAISSLQNKARADQLAEETTTIGRLLQVDDFISNLVDCYYYSDVIDPGALVNQTKLEAHNEVLVLGSISGSLASACAIFVKVTSTNMMWKSFMDEDMQYGLGALMVKCSRNLGIPIIEIPDNRGEASKMDFKTWKNTTSKLFP
jgi:hypothetical protein